MRRLPSLTALRFFEETARHLSFNRAAVALCVTQGAVSRQIRLLEGTLGVKLFERDHRGIQLTPAGSRLMPAVSEAFDVIEHGTRLACGYHARQRLIVSMPPTFATQWFSQRLAALAVQLPDVDLSIRTQPSDACQCSVRFGRTRAAQGHSELLMMERHVLAASPTWRTVPLDALLDRLPALHVLHDDARLDLWPNWLGEAGLPARYAENGIEFSSLEQAIQAAKRGVGLAVVDRNMIADELAEGALVRLSAVEVRGPYGYWLDTPVMQAGTQAFASWLVHEARSMHFSARPQPDTIRDTP